MIKTLLLDVDGVLAFGKSLGNYLALDYRITRELTDPFFKGAFIDCLKGQADVKSEIAPYLPQWGWSKTADELLSAWLADAHQVNAPLVEMVQAWRSQGISCYIATNQEQYRTTYIWEHMFPRQFDGIFSSATIGCLKTDIAFFEYILHALADVRKHEILFWDDRAAFVACAQQAGIHTECYTNLDDFVRMMQRYLSSTPPGQQ